MPEKLDATEINKLRHIVMKAPKKMKELISEYKDALLEHRTTKAEYEREYSKQYLLMRTKKDTSVADAEHKATNDDEVWAKHMLMISKEVNLKAIKKQMMVIDMYFTSAKKVLDSMNIEIKMFGG